VSIERARRHLDQFGWGDRIIETQASSATVAEAAQAVGTEPARIAKTLSFDLVRARGGGGGRGRRQQILQG
jgi:prolyl-tRNA editing enzyme YbaK/EbsC (Cys-tRNA(Pro) deacylase)